MQFEEIKSKIVVALDVKTLDEAKHLVDELKDYTGTFKVGLQLYCAFGNELVDYIKKHAALLAALVAAVWCVTAVSQNEMEIKRSLRLF